MLSKIFTKNQTKPEPLEGGFGHDGKEVFALHRNADRPSYLHAVPEPPYSFELRDSLGSLDDDAWYEGRLDELSNCELDEYSGQVLDSQIVEAASAALKDLADQREAHKLTILELEKLEVAEAEGLVRAVSDGLDELDRSKRDRCEKFGELAHRWASAGPETQVPTGSECDYGRAAALKDREASAYAVAARKSKLTVGTAVAVGSVLDVVLFFGPISGTLFSTPPLLVALLALASAAAPIAAAAMTALCIRKTQFEDAGAPNIALAVLMAIMTVGLLAAGWVVRANYWSDDTGVGFMLNVIALVLATAAFALELFESRKRMALAALRHEAIVERDLLEKMEQLKSFSSLHEIDDNRRSNDDLSYHRAVTDVPEASLGAGGRSRKAIAKRVAKNSDQLEFVMCAPLKVGSQELSADSRQDLIDKVGIALGAPSLQEITAPWDTAANSHSLSAKFGAALEGAELRLERIRAIGALDADSEQPDGAPELQDEALDVSPITATVID